MHVGWELLMHFLQRFWLTLCQVYVYVYVDVNVCMYVYMFPVHSSSINHYNEN